MKKLPLAVLASGLMFISTVALADSPKNLTKIDSHSYEAKGLINLYRAQMQGLEIGEGQEKLDAEILISLDTDPARVFGVRLHENSPPINKVIADTLREAYMKNVPVTLYYQKIPGPNVKIHMVQLDKK